MQKLLPKKSELTHDAALRGLITLLPFWKACKLSAGQNQVGEKTRTLSAFRLGLASGIALFLVYFPLPHITRRVEAILGGR